VALFLHQHGFEGGLKGIGPFVGTSLNESLLTAEAFVSINSVLALLLSAAIFERQEKEYSLKSARNNLEHVVAESTKELNEKNEELQKRNKELTLFSYAVSHDLQEPLRKIEFFAGNILEDENGLSAKGKNYFRRIRGSSIKMKHLIENLLSYSIVEGNKTLLENTDLNLILQQVKNDLEHGIRRAGAFIESDSLPIIKGIPVQWQELFTNIITNSIKFRKQNGPLHIRIQSETVKGVNISHFTSGHDEEYYHLSFSDNGIGFEPQYADTIFDILQKLHGQNEYEGTEIGLAICKKVVENHRGFISASGESDKGCMIHIYLPLDSNAHQSILSEDQKKPAYS